MASIYRIIVLSTHLHHAIATYGQAIDRHCPADALRFALPSPLLTPTSVLLSDVLGDLPVFREPSSPPTTLGHGSRHFDRPGTYTTFTTPASHPLLLSLLLLETRFDRFSSARRNGFRVCQQQQQLLA
jgi:hypothetical protein